jgi:hypothetical protein
LSLSTIGCGESGIPVGLVGVVLQLYAKHMARSPGPGFSICTLFIIEVPNNPTRGTGFQGVRKRLALKPGNVLF